jgi:hypothetical protein
LHCFVNAFANELPEGLNGVFRGKYSIFEIIKLPSTNSVCTPKRPKGADITQYSLDLEVGMQKILTYIEEGIPAYFWCAYS